MWAIRVLTGSLAGQLYQLKQGVTTLGRSEKADINLTSNGISKLHLHFQTLPNKLIIKDLGSSNGTFLNGTRVQSAVVQYGDKIGIHETIIEIVNPAAQQSLLLNSSQVVETSHNQNRIVQQQDLFTKSQNYLENILLPGVYQLTKYFEFRFILLGFAALFILITTILSIFPMRQITSESIEIESKRRAQTVARSLANANEKIIRNGDLTNFSTEFVLREDGIEDVYIVSKDGIILAPPERAGSRPKEVGFMKEINGQAKEISSIISNQRVAAAFPIVAFDPEFQQNVAKAHAVVIFNISSLQFDDGRAFSLFVQMLILASLVGFILFYFTFKLVQYPFKLIANELDLALKENRDHVSINIRMQETSSLLTNINSLLNRAMHSESQDGNQIVGNKDHEMNSLCQMIGFPCLISSSAGFIISANFGFESLTGISLVSIAGTSIDSFPDQAMKKNMLDLIRQTQNQSGKIVSDSFEVSGHPLFIHCQALNLNSLNEIDYYIFTLTPRDQNEGGGS